MSSGAVFSFSFYTLAARIGAAWTANAGPWHVPWCRLCGLVGGLRGGGSDGPRPQGVRPAAEGHTTTGRRACAHRPWAVWKAAPNCCDGCVFGAPWLCCAGRRGLFTEELKKRPHVERGVGKNV